MCHRRTSATQRADCAARVHGTQLLTDARVRPFCWSIRRRPSCVDAARQPRAMRSRATRKVQPRPAGRPAYQRNRLHSDASLRSCARAHRAARDAREVNGEDGEIGVRPSGFFLRSAQLGVDAERAMLTAADTAYSMAFMRALEKERPASERLFDDPYAALFSAGGAHASEGTSLLVQAPFFVHAVRLRTRSSSTTSFARGFRGRRAPGRAARRWLRHTRASACRRSRRARPACTRSTSPSSWRRSCAHFEAGGVRLPAQIAAVACDFMGGPGLTIRCTSRSGRAAFGEANARCSSGKGSPRISTRRRSTAAFDSW